MVQNLESTAKAVEAAGLEKGDKNPSLNLVDIKTEPLAKTPEVQSKASTDGTLKGFPTVDLVDSGDSAKKAENRSSFDKKDTPRFEGTGNWAPLEGYSLATDNGPSKAEQNRKAFDTKEPPKFEGTGNWAPLEGYTLATGKEQPAHAKPVPSLKEQNRKAFDTKEPPRFEGTGNW